ncbi:hypothetical protein T02_7259, partial [Trichinella nativa]
RGRGRKVTTHCNDRGDSPVTEAHTRQPQRKTWYIAINTTNSLRNKPNVEHVSLEETEYNSSLLRNENLFEARNFITSNITKRSL